MGKRVRRFQNVNTTTQGVDTSVTRPTEVAQSPEVIRTQASSMDKDGNVLDRTQTMGVTGSEKFTRDVGQGLYDSVEYMMPKENLGQLEYERWQRGDPEYGGLSERGIVSGTIDTALGDHTWDEWYANVEKRVTEEPGRVVGEAIGDTLTAFGFTKATKYVHKGSQIAEKALKAKYVTNKSKLAETAMTSATGPTRAETIHATKMAKFNKSVGDVNKLNKEVNVASTKVRDEDVIIRGNRTYSKTTNPNEPRSQVDLYYQRLNEGGPPDVNVGGGFKDPAQAIGGFGKSIDEISPSSLRGSGVDDKMFKAAQFNVNKVQKDETVKALTNVAVKEDAWLAKAESNLLKDWRKFGGFPSTRESFTINKNTEFLKGDKFLTGIGVVGAGAGGLGVFGLGGRKNDKSN